MKIPLFSLCLIFLFWNTCFSQKEIFSVSQRQMEVLDRGIVAVRTSPDEVFISWRLLGTDPSGIRFNLYRGNKKLNPKPLNLKTNYTDKIQADETYSVRAVLNGKEQKENNKCTVWKQPYLKIALNRPPDVTPSDRRQYAYSPGDVSVGDLDGDGQYEIVLKWDPSNARDNAQDGFTGNVIINASLLLFTTTIPTDYRMVTLMHDPLYRLGIAWQNVVYNQPPHLGFYIGDGIKDVPEPSIFYKKQ